MTDQIHPIDALLPDAYSGDDVLGMQPGLLTPSDDAGVSERLPHIERPEQSPSSVETECLGGLYLSLVAHQNLVERHNANIIRLGDTNIKFAADAPVEAGRDLLLDELKRSVEIPNGRWLHETISDELWQWEVLNLPYELARLISLGVNHDEVDALTLPVLLYVHAAAGNWEPVEAWLHQHNADFQREVKVVEEYCVEGIKEFDYRVRHAIEHQGLPLTIEDYESRIGGVQLRLVDGLLSSEAKRNGSYDIVTQEVGIAVSHDFNKEEVVEYIFHELLHKLSGQRRVTRGDAEEVTQIGFMNRKSGTWLNEAATQFLAKMILHPEWEKINFGKNSDPIWIGSKAARSAHIDAISGNTSYPTEQRLMNNVVSVPASTLLRAYFADYKPDGPRGHRMDAHKELARAIFKLHGLDGQQLLRDMEMFHKGDPEHRDDPELAKWRANQAFSKAHRLRPNPGLTIEKTRHALKQRKRRAGIVAAKKLVHSDQ